MGNGPAYAAIGIPQGVYTDGASGEVAGAVRRGGELLSLETVEYALWAMLLTPMALDAAVKATSPDDHGRLTQAMAKLSELDLVVPIAPGEAMGPALERLRPLPLGVGLGNGAGDGTRFEIQNATLSLPSPVSLDVVAIMFWWEFDGARSLRDAARRVAAQLPALNADRADAVLTELVYGLMASRLLYLDGLAPGGSE